MAELDKVIYDIERCICRVPDACRDCSHQRNGDIPLECMEKLMGDALELLKEFIDERHYYEEWKEGYGKNQPQIVRCKDCKYYEDSGWYTQCSRHDVLSPAGDWFCADGERNEKQ